MTDKPSRGRGRKDEGQLSVWGPDTEVNRPVPAAQAQRSSRPPRQLARVNPAMADWARRTAGVSVDRAAKRAGVKPEVLLAWETGAAQPTIRQLREIARLYHRPLAAFYLPAPPRTFTVAKDYRRLPGQPPIDYSPALLLALRVADYRRDVVLELEPETPPAAFVGSGRGVADSNALAESARALLGVSLQEQQGWRDEYAALNGWKNAVERLGVLVFHFSGVETEEARGFSISDPVLPVIGLNGGESPNARIFTLIHELGHLLLGEGGSCDLAEFSRPSDPALDAEVLCNAFAGALLVPTDALLTDPLVARASAVSTWTDADLARLARTFRVSTEVVLRRLLTLDRTSLGFYRSWRAALPTEAAPKTSGRPGVAVMTVRDVGKPFARLVVDAYHANTLTGGDLSELLGVKLKHLPAIEMRLAGPDMLTGGEQ